MALTPIQLKTKNNTLIRTKTQPRTLSPSNISEVLDDIIDASATQAGNIYYLSQQGCISDADISIDSVTFGTDNTAAVQALLNLASATNPIKVVVDGQYSVTGLIVKGNTIIEGLNGCGFILRNNSNKALFNSRAVVSGGRDRNITLKNLILNCNAFNSLNVASQTHDNSTEGWVTGIRIAHADFVRIEDCQIYKPATFTIQMWDVTYFYINNNYIDVGTSAPLNTDGIHINGNSHHGWIANNTIRAFDDHLTLGADDGFGFDPSVYNATLPLYGSLSSNWLNGPITDVYIKDNNFIGGYFGIGVRSGMSRVDRIFIENTAGVTSDYGILIDNFVQAPASIGGGTGNIGSVYIKGFNVVTPARVSNYVEKTKLTIAADFELIKISDYRRTDFGINDFPSILFHGGHTGGSLIIDNYDANSTSTNNCRHVEIRNSNLKLFRATNCSIINTNLCVSPFLSLVGTSVVDFIQLNTACFLNTGDYTSPSGLMTAANTFAQNIINTTSTTPPVGSLIAEWHMDETSGNASDSSGNGYHLTNNGGLTYSAGFLNNAANFASGKYLSSTAIPIPTNAFSVKFMLKINTFATSGYEFYIGAWNELGNKCSWTIYQYNVGVYQYKLHFITSDNGTTGSGHITDLASTVAISSTPGTWVNVIVTFGSGAHEIFINGVSGGTASSTYSSIYGSPSSFTIGTDHAHTSYFDGQIDEVQYYNYQLSALEIAALQ